jgi:hypothetical protein
MLQVDGSPHDWLEGRGPSLCLIGAIDDATGKVVGALFVEAESSWAYFRLFSEIFNKIDTSSCALAGATESVALTSQPRRIWCSRKFLRFR